MVPGVLSEEVENLVELQGEDQVVEVEHLVEVQGEDQVVAEVLREALQVAAEVEDQVAVEVEATLRYLLIGCESKLHQNYQLHLTNYQKD